MCPFGPLSKLDEYAFLVSTLHQAGMEKHWHQREGILSETKPTSTDLEFVALVESTLLLQTTDSSARNSTFPFEVPQALLFVREADTTSFNLKFTQS
jgi:hypothetical protein